MKITVVGTGYVGLVSGTCLAEVGNAVGAVVGWICPLTVWEDALRRRGGESGYGMGFVQYWLERLLYHDWPDWAFTVLYLAVFGAILAAWWLVPPRRSRGGALKNRA